jgi:hypothetical protein
MNDGLVEVEIDTLRSLEQRVLWLAVRIVDYANRERQCTKSHSIKPSRSDRSRSRRTRSREQEGGAEQPPEPPGPNVEAAPALDGSDLEPIERQ